jgi:hypothetical protein
MEQTHWNQQGSVNKYTVSSVIDDFQMFDTTLVQVFNSWSANNRNESWFNQRLLFNSWSANKKWIMIQSEALPTTTLWFKHLIPGIVTYLVQPISGTSHAIIITHCVMKWHLKLLLTLFETVWQSSSTTQDLQYNLQDTRLIRLLYSLQHDLISRNLRYFGLGLSRSRGCVP